MIMNKQEKQFQEFVGAISKMEQIEFLGLARFFNVALTTSDNKPVPFDALLEEVLDKYLALNRTQQKNALKLVKDVVKRKKR